VGERSPELLLLPGLRLVKIDPQVTAALTSSRAAQARVVGTAQMARIAGVHVVAKRIEQAQEQALLQALGVDFVQGYATALPAALDAFDAARERRMLIDPALDPLAAALAELPATGAGAGRSGAPLDALPMDAVPLAATG